MNTSTFKVHYNSLTNSMDTKLKPRHQHTHNDSSRALLRSKSGSTFPITSSPSSRASNTKNADRNGYVTLLPRNNSKVEIPRRTRSASTSPSAWALSPGRTTSSSTIHSSPFPNTFPVHVPKSPARNRDRRTVRGGEEGKGVMSGVLSFFRQKKVSPLLEEEYNRYRVAYNRLLQWMFANARAQKSMAVMRRAAQKKLFNGWARVSIARNSVFEKRIQIEKLRRELKLHHVIKSEANLLNQWSKMEPRNVEAVGRVVRKLSAISVCLPLVQNAEGNAESVYDAMSNAVEVMDRIKAMIADMHWEVERTCFLLTELTVILKQEKQYVEELEKRISTVASLEVQENSLKAHHMQLAKEYMETRER